MLTKNELKYYSSLLTKKFRKQENKFIIEGPKLIKEAIDANFKCEIVFVTKTFSESNLEIIEDLKKNKSRIEIIKTNDFEKLSETKTPQEIIAVFLKKLDSVNEFLENLIVALEDVSDPGNLGTIIRNCDWFGIRTVLLSEACAEIYNPKVIRASAGSVFHLSIMETKDFYLSLSELKKEKYHLVCADTDGKNLYQFEKSSKKVVVFSNEANGPTNQLLGLIDEKVTIPGKGSAESLNVASASAVILSELTR